MAAKLQCEICGGKLIGRPGGVFECDSCGMEYDTAWAKSKIQEITGTVKVEGTVEVTGKVQIEGPVKVEGGASKEGLLQRGKLAVEDGKWEDAKDFFNRALDLDAQDAEAYLGLAMAEAETKDRAAYAAAYAAAGSQIRGSRHAARARQFDPALERWLAGLDERGCAADEAVRIAREKAAKEKRIAQMKKAEEDRIRLADVRERFILPGRMIAAGYSHAVGLKTDGMVVAAGKNDSGQCEVSGWRNITAITAGCDHTVGLKADGTVVAVGSNNSGQCNVSGWKDLVAVAAGSSHTVGLKADGMVVATKYSGNPYWNQGQCEVSDWTDITAIAAGGFHTVGLKTDGTVVAVGSNDFGQCKVSGWTDIVAVAAGSNHTVGLKADGTVVAVGSNLDGECDVSGWTDIVAISAGSGHTVGLKADGSVRMDEGIHRNIFMSFCVDDWSGGKYAAVAVGDRFTARLRANGAVEASAHTDRYSNSQRDYKLEREASGWKLFENVDTLEKEWSTAEAERKARIPALKKEQGDLQTELANLRGMFTGKRRKEIETRLAQIDAELKMLG